MAASRAEASSIVLIKSALSEVLSEIDSIAELKQEQEHAITEYISGKDVLAVLPTGYGKSLIYQLAPLVLKKMYPTTNPVFIVISPLNALMEDQIQEASKFGITALQLGVHPDRDIMTGRGQLVFGSPEAWMKNKWTAMLADKVYRRDLMGIVVDEVHMTYKWGLAAKGKSAFRDAFAKLGELRSIVKQGTPVLAVTASADMESRNRVCKLLEMETATRLEVSPSRPNIRLGVVPPPKDLQLQCLDWIVDDVKDKGQTMAPILIYCRSLSAVAKVYTYLKAELEDDAWVNKDPDHKAESQLIGMFHAKTLPHYKKRVVDSLNGQGNCRVAVCTTALGLGMNFQDIQHVVMYGAPQEIESIVQQVGRAGRNGRQAHAILYNVKGSGKVDQEVRDLVQMAKTSCFRKALFAKFEKNTVSLQPGHICCTFCHKQCSCNGSSGCSVPVPSFEVVKSVPVFDISKIQSPYPQDSLSQTDMYFLDHFDAADDNPDSESDDMYDDDD